MPPLLKLLGGTLIKDIDQDALDAGAVELLPVRPAIAIVVSTHRSRL
jgi:hypothetical protein